jgi:hypothetical protein
MTYTDPRSTGPTGPVETSSGNWWRRLGVGGQVTLVAAFIGLVAALVPVGVAVSRSEGPDREAAVVTTDTPTRTSPTEAPRKIRFTISDQLTDGVEEEVVVVTMQGVRVASLHATLDDPIVTQTVTAAAAGSVAYVCDAEMVWYDAGGRLKRFVASGRGTVQIRDGSRLDVYIHIESDGDVSLSLQVAAGS